jgi:signal transduction histidine kinase
VVAAVALVVLLHRSLLSDVDSQATLRLEDVAALAQRDQVPDSLAGADDGTVAQVVANGRVIAQSPLIRGSDPLTDVTPAPGQVVMRTLDHPPIGDGDSDAYRVAATQVSTPSGPVVVLTAAPLDPVTETMDILQVLLLVLVPALILVVGVTTWRLVGRTLEPVEAIRRQVAEISATALDHRVPVPATGDEVDRLAHTMNAMLDRLDAAARRQRSFVADASHELGSPLATIRAKLEVGLARPTTVDWPRLAEAWLAEQARLERLVQDLLLLARVDEGVPVRAPVAVDLDELVLREAGDLRARGRVRVDVAEVGGGRVRGDAEQLRRVVSNLLDNAERHATSTVHCGLRQDGGTVELEVRDDGPGIAPAERERVFERFVRVDEARNRSRGGTGLGLAIVRDIVTAHGGTAEVSDTPSGARLVVRLPAAT